MSTPEAADDLEIEPLYVAMTRPAMLWGVSILFFFATGFATVILFLGSGSLLSFFVWPVLHVMGYVLTARDFRFAGIWFAWARHCGQNKAKRFWGCNTYQG